MTYQLNLQNCQLSNPTYRYLEYQIKKLDRFLPKFARGMPSLSLFIEGHRTRRFFDGSIVLRLPKQTLNAHFRSSFLDRAVKLAFAKIRRKIRSYKGKHFVGDSEYPKREATFQEE